MQDGTELFSKTMQPIEFGDPGGNRTRDNLIKRLKYPTLILAIVSIACLVASVPSYAEGDNGAVAAAQAAASAMGGSGGDGQ